MVTWWARQRLGEHATADVGFPGQTMGQNYILKDYENQHIGGGFSAGEMGRQGWAAKGHKDYQSDGHAHYRNRGDGFAGICVLIFTQLYTSK